MLLAPIPARPWFQTTSVRLSFAFLLLATILAPALRAEVPGILAFQGRVATNGVPFNGTGQFRFALVDPAASTTYWSNDGTSTSANAPTAAVPLPVTRGLYSVLLGDTSLVNTTAPIPPGVFSHPDIRLRIWFDDGVHGSQLLAPDQRVAASAYALVAAAVPDHAITLANLASGLADAAATPGSLVLRDPAGGFAAGSLSLSGVLALPQTSGAGAGVLTLGGVPFLHGFGGSNTFLGTNAGNFTVTGIENTGMGAFALASVTSGSYNTAQGVQALLMNTTGNQNTAQGDAALFSNTAGSFNTAQGVLALFSNTVGPNNTAQGVQALLANTTGGNNTAQGVNALRSNTNGSENTAQGVSALFSNTVGANNTAQGVSALRSNTNGSFNTALGLRASFGNTSGSLNTATGVDALHDNTAGGFNTANGVQALHHTAGSTNIGIGFQAGFNLTTGNNNIDIGNLGVAGESGVIRIGTPGTHTATYLAGSVTASGNLALPTTSGSTTGVVTLGGAPFLHGFGTGNTFAGPNAGNFTLTGSYNSALGREALVSLSSGSHNTAQGLRALQANTTGGLNTATGVDALHDNTAGDWNTADGVQALYYTTGGNNIGIGFQAGFNLTTGNNNIDIGNPGVSGESGIIRIGTPGTHTATYLAGNVQTEGSVNATGGFNVGGDIRVDGNYYGLLDGSYYALDNSGSTASWRSSDRRLKEDIEPIPDALASIRKLRGVTYHWNEQGLDHETGGVERRWKSLSGTPEDDRKLWEKKRREAHAEHSRLQVGFVAQEVEEIFPDWVRTNADGFKQIDMSRLNAVLVNAVKEQQDRIDDQAREIRALREQAHTLEQKTARLTDLEHAMARMQEAFRHLEAGLEARRPASPRPDARPGETGGAGINN